MNKIETAGEIMSFSFRYFREAAGLHREIKETLKQFYILILRSLPLVSITGLILGLTLALQLKPTLQSFGAEKLIPSLLSVSILREIGPIIISLICAGKMGSAIGAELGSMKVTEQIAAMEASAVRPFSYLVVTRVTAATIGVPLLIIYANALALAGGFIALKLQSDISVVLYTRLAFDILGFNDVIPPFLKTFVFGYTIGIVGAFKGYNCSRGTESVGLAANSAVVLSSLLIILLDMIAVQISTIF
ncbi:MAG: ABC transporter permease [Bacteroidetes bacterium]|nr:ABC transporter permease [Bacteroidota bacterium]